jgi:hypothetical protein
MDKVTRLQPKKSPKQPPIGPREPVEHLSQPFTHEDLIEGRRLAWALGSLELDASRHSPEVQWATVAKAFRLNGRKIFDDLRA